MKIKFLQQGGAPAPAPAEGGAPAQGGGPEEQIAQMATQIVQQLGPEGAMMLAQAIAQLVQQAPAAAPAEGGQPQFAREGGKLVRRN